MFTLVLVLAFPNWAQNSTFPAKALTDDGSPLQSKSSYEKAVRNRSTSPSYVMIKVVDVEHHDVLVTCTMAGSLLWAIETEYGLSNNSAGLAIAEKKALDNSGHIFQFTNKKALEAVMPTYSEKDISEVRAELAPLSDEQLGSGFSLNPWGELHNKYGDNPLGDAAACVLIERGFSPGIADRVGTLYIQQH